MPVARPVVSWRMGRPQGESPEGASLNPPGLPRTGAWAPLPWTEALCCFRGLRSWAFQGAVHLFGCCLQKRFERPGACLPWPGQLLTRAHTLPCPPVGKGLEETPSSPGAASLPVCPQEGGHLSPWSLMESVMKMAAVSFFEQAKPFTDPGTGDSRT